jgi:hypothetical protein
MQHAAAGGSCMHGVAACRSLPRHVATAAAGQDQFLGRLELVVCTELSMHYAPGPIKSGSSFGGVENGYNARKFLRHLRLARSVSVLICCASDTSASPHGPRAHCSMSSRASAATAAAAGGSSCAHAMAIVQLIPAPPISHPAWDTS